MFLNIIKASYGLILNGEQMKSFPLKSGMRQRCSLSPLLFSIVLEFLARAIRQVREIKGNQTGKEVKISLLTDNIILHIKDPNNLTKTLRNHKHFDKVAG
jgi:hypothetical protein